MTHTYIELSKNEIYEKQLAVEVNITLFYGHVSKHKKQFMF